MRSATRANIYRYPAVPTVDDWLRDTALNKLWEREWPRPIVYEHKHGTKCAELFISQRHPRKIVSSNGILYSLHSDGLWRELTESQLESEITATDRATFLDVHNIKRMVQSIHQRHAVKEAPFEWLDRRDGDPNPEDLMIFDNGRYDVTRDTLVDHDGRYFATETPGFDYQPGATCRLWDRAVAEWLVPTDQRTLHEFMGYLLTADMSLQKMLVMLGPPRSGKSTVMSVMELLCGRVHVLSRTIDDLCGPYGLDGAQGKRLMTIPDAHDANTKSHHVGLNRLKSITGRDTLSINKKYRSIDNVRLSTRIVMHANRHPQFMDESGALAAREIILSFKQSFLGKEDELLSLKLTSQLSGIANRAISGLRRLRANNNKFTKGQTAKSAMETVREDQSPAFAFARACLEITADPGDFLPDNYLKQSYDGYCHLNGIKGPEKKSITQLKRDLETAFSPGVVHTQRRVRPFGKPPEPRHGLKGIASATDPHFNQVFRLGPAEE